MKKIKNRIVIFYVILFVLTGCTKNMPDLINYNEPIESDSEKTSIEKDNLEQLLVHYINVGQGDSILIELPNNEIMLIDAGGNENANKIVEYLKNKNISKVDYLIATHAHEDHIGGMDEVIYTFEIKNMYMPKKATNTKTFEDLLDAAEKKRIRINNARANLSILNDESNNLIVEIIAPNSNSYNNINNYSAVVKLTYHDVSFLFMGDAESISEKEILKLVKDIKSDIIKIGHHGSNSSSTQKFLESVSPEYAIISCGSNNSYGHPTIDILNRLESLEIEVYRTDIQGTIIFVSDGREINEIKFEKVDSESTDNEDNLEIVYITKSGKKYHKKGCIYLKNPIKLYLSEEVLKEYQPCSICN